MAELNTTPELLETSIESAPVSFFEQRVKIELGVTDELNHINLKAIYPDEKRVMPYEANIFSEDEMGNIRIMAWTLDRQTIEIPSDNSDPLHNTIANGRQKTWYITRLREPKEIKTKDGGTDIQKYLIPKGAGTYPFITPGIVEKFESKTKIKTLCLTEGFFKAFKGYMHGLDIIGLSSITHMMQKDTKGIYTDIIRVIKECKVENVIMLYDGDCLDISRSAFNNERDLYTRPITFYKSAEKVADLLKSYDVSIYWAMVNSAEIEKQPKGLDDLLIQFKGSEEQIIDDLIKISNRPTYFRRLNITANTSQLHREFGFKNIRTFYDMHSQIIGTRPFVYYGTKYQYNSDKDEVEVIMPGMAKNYFRVGDVYYEFINIPNQYGQLETYFHKRKKETIAEDYGKSFIKHVAKYKAFCNVPDNTNYQQVIHNCFNVFHPFPHTPELGECPKTLAFFQHIFQEHYEMGLDYVQLLYQQPTQILPILCLVSKENSTGKSTFGYYLKELFAANMCIIGNAELQDNFNSAWSTKLIICCDEAFIEKKVVIERIKMLSTAKKITSRAMQTDGEEIDFFGKFILISNNEENFIYATEEDIRYWVRKVPRIPRDKLDADLIKDLVDEIPAFINMLNNRQMTTQKDGRMWFNEKLIETDALKRVRQHSRARVEKVIEKKIASMFIDFGDEEIKMSIPDINRVFFNGRQDDEYLEKILKEKLNVEHFTNKEGKKVVNRYSFPQWEEYFENGKKVFKRVEYERRGRPYLFKREKFLSHDDLNITYEKEADEPEENTLF